MSHPASDPVGTPRPGAKYANKINGLQMLRAVAVLLVTWLHSNQDNSAFYRFQTYSDRAANLGAFGVDIFFAISGFILTMVAMRPGRDRPVRQAYNFFVRRLIRIYPIYWILMALPIAELVHRHQFEAGWVLHSLLLFPGLLVPMQMPIIGFAWTLMFEMFFYATIAVLILFNPRKAPRNSVLTLISLVVLGSVIGIHHPLLILVGNPFLLEFVGGAVLALFYQKILTRWISTETGDRRGAIAWV